MVKNHELKRPYICFMIFSFLLFFHQCLFSEIPSSSHDLHLSKTELVYNNQNHTIEVTIHLFIDDLELALAEMGYLDLYICTEREDQKASELIGDYILNKIDIIIDGNDAAPQFLGKEVSDDLMGIWCYLEVDSIDVNESISVNVDFFNDLYEDQKNILNLKLNSDNQEYFLLNGKKTQADLKTTQ